MTHPKQTTPELRITCAIGLLANDGGFRGRYIDTGGMPNEVGPRLAELIAQAAGDVTPVLDVLTVRHDSWVNLNPDPTVSDHPGSATPFEHTVHVPGYGQAFPAKPGDDHHWVRAVLGQRDELDTDVQWLYGVTNTQTDAAPELVVLDRNSDERARFPLTALPDIPPATWYDVECGPGRAHCWHGHAAHTAPAPDGNATSRH